MRRTLRQPFFRSYSHSTAKDVSIPKSADVTWEARPSRPSRAITAERRATIKASLLKRYPDDDDFNSGRSKKGERLKDEKIKERERIMSKFSAPSVAEADDVQSALSSIREPNLRDISKESRVSDSRDEWRSRLNVDLIDEMEVEMDLGKKNGSKHIQHGYYLNVLPPPQVDEMLKNVFNRRAKFAVEGEEAQAVGEQSIYQVLGRDKCWIMWFIMRWWNPIQGLKLKDKAKRYIILPPSNSQDSSDTSRLFRILVQFPTLHSLSSAYLQSPSLLLIQPTLWPTSDPCTTTIRLTLPIHTPTPAIYDAFPYLPKGLSMWRKETRHQTLQRSFKDSNSDNGDKDVDVDRKRWPKESIFIRLRSRIEMEMILSRGIESLQGKRERWRITPIGTASLIRQVLGKEEKRLKEESEERERMIQEIEMKEEGEIFQIEDNVERWRKVEERVREIEKKNHKVRVEERKMIHSRATKEESVETDVRWDIDFDADPEFQSRVQDVNEIEDTSNVLSSTSETISFEPIEEDEKESKNISLSVNDVDVEFDDDGQSSKKSKKESKIKRSRSRERKIQRSKFIENKEKVFENLIEIWEEKSYEKNKAVTVNLLDDFQDENSKHEDFQVDNFDLNSFKNSTSSEISTTNSTEISTPTNSVEETMRQRIQSLGLLREFEKGPRRR